MKLHFKTMGIAGVGLAMLTLCCAQAHSQNESPGRKLAFLVGVKTYDHADLKNLDFPENDVEELATVLANDGFETVVLTTSRGKQNDKHKPTAENIRGRLKALLRGVTKRDLIVVGLAGHGIQPLASDDSYFCPADAIPVIKNDKPIEPGSLISVGEVLAQMSDSGIGYKLLLVDACRNDPSARSARRRGVDHVNVSALPSQTGVLLSCSQGEFSFEDKSLALSDGLKGHGVFFYHVIEGLKGAAKDGKSQVTWDGLGSYVRTEVPDTVQRLYGKDGGEQSPNAIGNLRGAPPVLARIDRTSIRPSTSTQPSSATPPTEEKPKESAPSDDPWVKEAEHLLLVGNYAELDKLTGARLRQEPGSAVALTYRAAVLNQNSQTDDAIDALNKAIRLDKADARAYDLRGNAYRAKADYDLALLDFSEAIRLAPESAGYYMDRGSCYCSMQSWSSAIADANRALQLDANSADAYQLRALAKNGESGGGNTPNETAAPDAREAVRLFQKKVESDRGDRWALRGLAGAYTWLNDHQRAIETYNKLIQQGWGVSHDFNSRGAQYAEANHHEWAIADFTKAIDRNPRDSTAYGNRSSSYVNLKRYDDAIGDATEAIRLDPRDAYAYSLRGIAYSWKNNVEQARADFQQALRLDPNNRTYMENLQSLNK